METHNKSNTEFRNEVSEILTPYESSFKTLNYNYNQLHSTMQTVLTELQALHVNSSTHLPNPPELNFPTFGGKDPTGWIYKAEQYIEFKDIAYHQRVQLTSFHLEGIDEFTKVVHLRFGPTDYENPSEALSRLKQMTTV
ncbi:hypothetical protein ACOSP7_028091 [Xanthoceras sorbifolium]